MLRLAMELPYTRRSLFLEPDRWLLALLVPPLLGRAHVQGRCWCYPDYDATLAYVIAEHLEAWP